MEADAVPDKVTISHRGARFEIGRGKRYYGIWVADAPESDPVDRWPETPDGWVQAWTRFASMEEPGAITAVEQRGLRLPRVRLPRPRPMAAGKAAKVSVALTALGVIAGIAGLFPDYISGQGSLASQSYQLVQHLFFLVGWTAGGALVLAGTRHGRDGSGGAGGWARAGALAGIGIGVVSLGMFLADYAQAASGSQAPGVGAGLVLGLIGWAACTAGSAAGLAARRTAKTMEAAGAAEAADTAEATGMPEAAGTAEAAGMTETPGMTWATGTTGAPGTTQAAEAQAAGTAGPFAGAGGPDPAAGDAAAAAPAETAGTAAMAGDTAPAETAPAETAGTTAMSGVSAEAGAPGTAGVPGTAGAAGTATTTVIAGTAETVASSRGPGRPVRPRAEHAGPIALLVLGAIGTAAAFAPSWDSYTLRSPSGAQISQTLGNAFSFPGPVIAANVLVMVAIVAVAGTAALWRPMRQGAALLAGGIIPMAAQGISALIQVSQPASPLLFGITPAQASAAGLTIASGVTPAFWVYCVFIIALVISGAWLLTEPALPATPRHAPAPWATPAPPANSGTLVLPGGGADEIDGGR